jgi:predicted RNase H-like HicB family nuclease
MRDFDVVLEREEDGRYSAYVPDLPGCASMGDNKREALRNIKEAVASYLAALHKLRKRPPRRRTRIEVVQVKAA